MRYCLLIRFYSDSSKNQTLIGEWGTLINVAMGASMIADLTWTRPPQIGGCLQHMDFYSDMFNEGLIVLGDAEKVKQF